MPPRNKKKEDNLTLEDIRIIFRNFRGLPGPFNREGDKNFCVILEDPSLVKYLEKEGWNVKYLKAREEGDTEQPYLQVKVNYNGKPPRVVMITSRKRTELGERDVDVLDWAEIVNADIIIGPYHWEVSGKTGISAYLQSLYVTIEEDELERKYSDVPRGE